MGGGIRRVRFRRPASVDTGGPMYQLRLLAGLVAAAMSVSTAWAQGNGNGHAKAAGPSMQTADTGQVTLVGHHHGDRAPDDLRLFSAAPGELCRNGPCRRASPRRSPGAAPCRRGSPSATFPMTSSPYLPARPGQQWVIVGTDVLLIQAGTSLILDLLARVLEAVACVPRQAASDQSAEVANYGDGLLTRSIA